MFKENELMTMEDMIRNLENIIKDIQNNRFEGCLSYSNLNNKQNFILSVKGLGEDRVNAIDNIFTAIYDEPIIESRNFMLIELYKRWKHYFGALYQAELNSLVNNKGAIV
jgi:hypothetical protein